VKLLFIIDSLGSGGAQRQLVNLATELKIRGNDIEIFLYHPGQNHFRDHIDELAIPVHEIRRYVKRGYSPFVSWCLLKLVLKGTDAIISWQSNANIYASILKISCPRLLWIASERSSELASCSLARRFVIRCALLLANHVVANSKSRGDNLREKIGLRKTLSIWNGYKIPAFQPIKNKLNKRLLIVGRISPEKNTLRILIGLSIFLERNGWTPNIYFAGRRDTTRNINRDFIKEIDNYLKNKPELAKSIFWLGEVKNVGELYASSDALLLASIFEGLPNVVCEAMMSGCPVIASNVCDHPVLLGKDEERGLLCDPFLPVTIYNAIERIYSMPFEERKEMLLNARSFAEENLSIDRMVDSYSELLFSDEIARTKIIS